jgi:hypothetical protein
MSWARSPQRSASLHRHRTRRSLRSCSFIAWCWAGTSPGCPTSSTPNAPTRDWSASLAPRAFAHAPGRRPGAARVRSAGGGRLFRATARLANQIPARTPRVARAMGFSRDTRLRRPGNWRAPTPSPARDRHPTRRPSRRPRHPHRKARESDRTSWGPVPTSEPSSNSSATKMSRRAKSPRPRVVSKPRSLAALSGLCGVKSRIRSRARGAKRRRPANVEASDQTNGPVPPLR